MLSLYNSLISLHTTGTKGCQDHSLLHGEWCIVPLTHEVDVWDPSICGMSWKELLLVDKAQLDTRTNARIGK